MRRRRHLYYCAWRVSLRGYSKWRLHRQHWRQRKCEFWHLHVGKWECDDGDIGGDHWDTDRTSSHHDYKHRRKHRTRGNDNATGCIQSDLECCWQWSCCFQTYALARSECRYLRILMLQQPWRGDWRFVICSSARRSILVREVGVYRVKRGGVMVTWQRNSASPRACGLAQ